jgi:hypothetical protein
MNHVGSRIFVDLRRIGFNLSGSSFAHASVTG